MRAFLAFFAALGALCAAPLQAQQARAGERADFILIDKSERTLLVYQDDRVIRRYTGLQYGDAPVGHKRFQVLVSCCHHTNIGLQSLRTAHALKGFFLQNPQ